MFSLIYARIIGWVSNDEAGDLRRHRAHYDVIVMINYKTGEYGIEKIQCNATKSVVGLHGSS